MFYTIATAGHIDHGKSTLVKALTGINPDRLPEEQAREMTIDLGFAWMTLPNGDEVGIVDVPGHERFIRNMISGVGGIDHVLFLVAADDGWMPQSQEHLEILEYLDHKSGAVILSKTDLVKQDWLEMVEEDIRNKVHGTFLERAPIIRFSARTNTGLEEVKNHLADSLPRLPARPNPHKPRLYIDRVFSLTGIGTVVTGTMRDGEFVLGQEVAVVPSGRRARIKSIQTFKMQRETAFQGARTALSLTGVAREEIARGDCLISCDAWRGTRQIALRLKISPENRIPLTHGRAVTALIGTTEAQSHARLFHEDKLESGREGVCLLEFGRDVMARLNDRVILRYPTPDLLVGGGVVADVDLQRFIRRDADQRAFYLERRLDRIEDLLLSELRKYKYRSVSHLLEAANFHRREIEKTLDQLILAKVVEKHGDFLIAAEFRRRLFERILEFLQTFHRSQAMRVGISKSELSSRLKLDPQILEFACAELEREGRLVQKENLYMLAGHKTSLKPHQEKIRQEILAQLAVSDLMTPTRKEIEQRMSAVREVLNYLIQANEVVELTDGILFRAGDFAGIRDQIIDYIKSHGSIEVKDVKGLLGLTRKYTIPILERLDREGLTRRDGDRRILNA